MKKIFFALVLFLASPMLQAQNSFSGGRGTKANPYTIATAAQLATLAQKVNAGDTEYNSKYYKLTADVDLSEYGATFNGSKGWIPIGTNKNRFMGNFDGNGKKISGLYINDASLNYAGLFGIVTGYVKNLGVENVNITGFDRVGGMTGSVCVLNGNLSNCYVTGTVKGNYCVGGVAGEVFSGCIVTNCYSTCTVIGKQNVGGVAGAVFDTGRLSYCYATGSISGDIYCVGGVAGWIHPNNCSVINCVALNTSVTAKEEAKGETGTGRVVGNNANTLSNNYAFDFLKDKNNQITSWNYSTHNSRDGANVGDDIFLTASFWKISENWNAVGWDESVWKFVDGELPVFKYVARL